MPDEDIRRILTDTTTIALVGASPNAARPSHGVMSGFFFQRLQGFPGQSRPRGQEILGQKVYAKLADIPEPVDMVDVFRASEHLSSVMEE